MNKNFTKSLLAFLGLCVVAFTSVGASATTENSSAKVPQDGLLTTTINAKFNQTWYSLYNEVKKAGYKTTYLQKCDFALKQRKYESDKYRILFFGEYKNMEYLSKKYPAIVPFLPLKIVVVENGDTTLLTTNPPSILLEIVDEKDATIINNWQVGMENIFNNIQNRYKKQL